jgi:serine/threonine protein phosphatase PrpC
MMDSQPMIPIDQIPTGHTDRQGIDMAGRLGNVKLQVRETIGHRESQEDQIFHITTPVTNKEAAAQLLKDAFAHADARTHYNQEGSCGTVAILTKDHALTIGHLGDSPVVLYVVDAEKKVRAQLLNKMHKPNEPIEKARIEAAGGFVSRGRVDGMLAISRAFGDHDLGDKVSKNPEITQITLSDYVKPGEKAYLCVSCDGLYEGEIPENHFAQIIQQALEKGEKNIANKMKDYAMYRGSGDNISVMLAELPDALTKSIALGVCDGHGGSLTAKQASAALQEVIAIGKPAPQPAKRQAALTAPGSLPYAEKWYTSTDEKGTMGGAKGDTYWYIELDSLPGAARREIEGYLTQANIKFIFQPGHEARSFIIVGGEEAEKLRVLKQTAPKPPVVVQKHFDRTEIPGLTLPDKPKAITPDTHSTAESMGVAWSRRSEPSKLAGGWRKIEGGYEISTADLPGPTNDERNAQIMDVADFLDKNKIACAPSKETGAGGSDVFVIRVTGAAAVKLAPMITPSQRRDVPGT